MIPATPLLNHAAHALLLVLALSLGACGESSPLSVLKRDTIEVGCPPMGALREAEELTRFRPGAGRDLTDVMFQAKIGRVVGECEVKQSTVVATVTAGLEIFGERGPALETDAAPIEYFIAIAAPNGAIASREAFTLPFDFRGGQRESRVFDYLTFQIPNATPETLRSYRVYFGLQMTQEEWAFSRRQQRR